MRDSVHIMLGADFEDVLVSLKKYIEKNGEEMPSSFFHSYLITFDKQQIEILSSNNSVEDKSDVRRKYGVVLNQERKFNEETENLEFLHFFDSLFLRYITVESKNNALHLCFYLPLYDINTWDKLKCLLHYISLSSYDFEIDVIGLTYDLSFLSIKNENRIILEREELLDQQERILEEVKETEFNINHFILLQNTQMNGLSLNLNAISFIRIIGELTLLFIENYSGIFIASLPRSKRYSVGISVLDLDKNYFIEFLLQLTYLHVLEKAGVYDDEVDANFASRRAHIILSDKLSLYSDYISADVNMKLDSDESQHDIVEQSNRDIKRLFDETFISMTSFLKDEKISLPQKQAILASILGEDDALLKGYVFDKSQYVFDDCLNETASLFIEIGNDSLEYDTDNLSKLIGLEMIDEKIYFPVELIKLVRSQIKESSNYIKSRQAELRRISEREIESNESEKRLSNDGFTYGGKVFRVFSDIKEKPLEETYKPVATKKKSVDLRKSFTAIKDQGTQGSCTAFTIASVFEYVLKTKSNRDINLSEAFLYYNARKRDNAHEYDGGASIGATVESVCEYGICLEQYHPYDADVYAVEPSADAYQDGKQHVVKKALNVNCDIKDIKSALSQGYPVIISLKIYDSFGEDGYKKGFVSRPTSDEISSGMFGLHSMVICGFSDAEKIFIVRNSWGSNFGDNGYCYLPYSYVDDNELLSYACIMTEFGSEYSVAIDDSFTKVNFDKTDKNIQAAIIKNLMDEEAYFVYQLSKEDEALRSYYFKVLETLKNNTKRTFIIEENKRSLSNNISECQSRKEIKIDHYRQRISDLDSLKRRFKVIFAVFVLLAFVLSGLALYYSYYELGSYVFGVTVCISVWLSWLIFSTGRKERMLQEERDDVLTKIELDIRKTEKKLNEAKLKLHIAGTFLDQYFHLKDRLLSTYNVMKSYVGNLALWYNEEKARNREMYIQKNVPSIPITENRILRSYFDINKDNITSNIDLYSLFDNYNLNEDSISKFKHSLENDVVNGLSKHFEDFSINNYITGTEYSYLKNKPNLASLIPTIDKQSTPFCADIIDPDTLIYKVAFTNMDDEGLTDQIRTIIDNYFLAKPLLANINSRDKFVMVQLQC